MSPFAHRRLAVSRFSAVLMVCALPVQAISQEAASQEDDAVYLVQAPENQAQRDAVDAASSATVPTTSPVYFPDEITPESVARARAIAAQQEQLSRVNEADADAAFSQVSATGEGARNLDQLSDGDSARALAQLSAAERQVLLDAVEGTDICERGTDIPAIRALCESRIETRSSEFGQPARSVSAEERLLGEGLDGSRIATIEAAISRLANSGANTDDFSNQVIASVALNNGATAPASDLNASEDEEANDLSAETQQLIAAIVQQLGGN